MNNMTVHMDRLTQIKVMTSEQQFRIIQLLAEPGKRFGQQWSADSVEFDVCMMLIAEALAVAQPQPADNWTYSGRQNYLGAKAPEMVLLQKG